MIDIHAHLLPGFDDGAQDWETALQMAALAVADGVKTVVATPHMRPDGPWGGARERVLKAVAELRWRLAEAEIGLGIQPGAEMFLSLDLPKRVADGTALSLGDLRKHVLMELPAGEVPACTEEVVFRLLLQGTVPVISHPERNLGIMRDPVRALKLVQQGALLQVNSGSLLGKFGTRVRKIADQLLTGGVVHFLASDAHSIRNRPLLLSRAVGRATELVGWETAGALVNEAPQRVLLGEEVASDPPDSLFAGAGWARRLRDIVRRR